MPLLRTLERIKARWDDIPKDHEENGEAYCAFKPQFFDTTRHSWNLHWDTMDVLSPF
eukprot:TRINITY_DN7937_c0_g1_i1.p1 TRINITY_DN7937_c0_g1~~TRINITY_DN7937_c0_g1_i1.p1  ORF type:complete len:57 (+),score=7.19 TRINITY_DN7937_c0_g1_i1:462-632(+)